MLINNGEDKHAQIVLKAVEEDAQNSKILSMADFQEPTRTSLPLKFLFECLIIRLSGF